MKELINIQSSLKAPKNQYNKFGNYKYRSAEDILEAVKPLLKANKCTMTLSDEVIAVADRIYIKATATLKNESGDTVTTTALARESETKKGMDDSQITGTASSYARKYCLNGLFLIDDTKDADTDEHHIQTEAPKKPSKPIKLEKTMPLITADQLMELSLIMRRKGVASDAICTACNVPNLESLTAQNYDYVMGRLANTPDKEEN